MQSRNKEYEAHCIHALIGHIVVTSRQGNRQKAMLRCKETVGTQYTSL